MSQDLYLSLPRSCQNIALSMYGMKLYRERFGSQLSPEYKQSDSLLQAPQLSDFEVQTQRLRKLLNHCKKFVPYYRPYLKSADISRLTGTTLADYLPILTKKIVLDNPDSFLSQAPEHAKERLIKLNTSGSSGTPLTLYVTREARRINYNFYERALNEFGCHYQSKSTTFAGRILYKKPGKSPSRFDYYNKTQYLSSYFISPDTIESYLNAMNSWQPDFIDSYPSAILEICALAQQKGLTPTFKPKVILTSSETLTALGRRTIEGFFGAPVLDHYGCTEMAISSLSSGGQYFSPASYSVIELEHAFDKLYSVITTGLLNFSMPLLRYEIGDLVSKPSDSNYIFDSIEGRTDDVIITPEGKRIGRMDPVFKGVEGVAQAQIVQKTLENIDILIKLNLKNSHLFNEELLISNVKIRTSDSMNVKIIYVDEIEKTKNGKIKSVVCLI
jgi:phenylacetate-CoA ligase